MPRKKRSFISKNTSILENKEINNANRLFLETTEDLYEHAPCGYMSTLPDGKIVKINQTLLSWIGWQRGQIVSFKRFQDLINIGGKIFYETHHSPLIKMQGFVNELSYELMVNGGGTVPVLVNSQKVVDEEDRILGYKNTFFNITDRKKYEQELLLAKKKAEKAVVAKTEFLSTISHEIRTPLNAIIGLTNILHEQDNNPENREYLNILKFSSNNLLALINDILDLSKIESGKVSLEDKDFDLTQLLRSIAGTFKLRTDKKGIEINLELDKNIPQAVVGDELKLGQVLTNLIGNAVKFTEQGSITIKAEVNDRLEKNNIIRFSIKDTGIGIPQNKLESIFEEFTQASSDISIKYGGTGLGLAISQKIIELYGGKLAVKSELNKGSEFYFTINLRTGVTENIHIEPQLNGQNKFKLSGSKILLCEDNLVNVIVASKFLKDWDIEVEVAENGKEGLAKIQENYYDLILMDIKMPLMDGYETTKAIRELPGDRYRKIPIIAMTASSDLSSPGKIEASQFNGFVSKPFDPKDLFNKLVKYLPLNFLSETTMEAFVQSNESIVSEGFSLDKIRKMAENDMDFLKGFIHESINSLVEYKSDFDSAIVNGDLQKIRDIEHKSKVLFDLLQTDNLISLIQKALYIIEESEQNPYEAVQISQKIHQEIERIIFELEKSLEYSG